MALTANEEAQLLQTIEMFEVITQSQPMDYQSLEILKEAYSKLSRERDVVSTSKRIAEAYVQSGQLSSAILEYESILQHNPDDPDVRHALAEIENRANSFAPLDLPSDSDFIEKQSAATALKHAGQSQPSAAQTEVEDGKAQMQKIFVDAKALTVAQFDQLWPKVNLRDSPRQPYEPFIQLLADRNGYSIETAIKLLCEKGRTAYLPIERYDLEAEFSRSFPRDLCLRWCVLPFDRMSKSILVSTANPFNRQALRELETHSKARVIWYVSNPNEIIRISKKIFR
jgi:hypothetical protein